MNEKPENYFEHKSFNFKLESADESSGEFSGYAAVFGNVDSGSDIIEKGAFTKTLKENFERIKILSHHNDCELPIGKPIELREDENGLYIRGKISNTQKGKDIQTLLRDGVLTELSIGYDPVVFEIDEKLGIRHLKEIRLWEISIVTWAMNEQAKIDEVKSAAEALKKDIKAGKISKTKLDTMRPFIAVIRELAEVLQPLLEPETDRDEETADTQSFKQGIHPVKENKKSGRIFRIIPTTNRR